MDEKNKPLNANKLIVESLNSLPLISRLLKGCLYRIGQ